MESLFHPVTNEWLGVKKSIHWACYVAINGEMQMYEIADFQSEIEKFSGEFNKI